jgi:hypothetical protein
MNRAEARMFEQRLDFALYPEVTPGWVSQAEDLKILIFIVFAVGREIDQHHAPSGFEYPVNLSGYSGGVHELNALATGDAIKAVGFEGQVFCPADHQFVEGFFGLSGHGWREVESDQFSHLAHKGPGDQTCATGQVEHGVVGLWVDTFDDLGHQVIGGTPVAGFVIMTCPRREMMDDVGVVDGGVSLTHDCFPGLFEA